MVTGAFNYIDLLNNRHCEKAFSAYEAIFHAGDPCCKDCFVVPSRNDEISKTFVIGSLSKALFSYRLKRFDTFVKLSTGLAQPDRLKRK
ncbi:hypothetical protein [Pedobacter suwonensis]|uniref:hypothetical protein n=1 Tax=Pedobacter suwonensis TaxID=332999 RepID=UPI0036A3E157